MGQKTEFLRALAHWIELAAQTASALTTTLRAHTVFKTKAYQYVITSRLQLSHTE